MIHRKQKYLGFTLIEVMAVIAIISIMSSILFVSFDGPRKQTYLDNAGRQFITDLRFVQQSALSGTVPSGITGSICGHGLHRTSLGGYQFFVIEKSKVSNDCTGTYSRTYDPLRGELYGEIKVFERGVTLGTASDMYFETPHASVYYNNNILTGNAYVLNLDSENFSVCVTSSGNIKEGGC
ncbi:MAG: prepilin-type N-terminal cleavage/methylation domain-containing protein [Candidatus Moranbacteria bacterium]|nr:prepilin-type N-terminal cleavage/methylation domain-containing protein [Candidatus Moranbacteria bacterium]